MKSLFLDASFRRLWLGQSISQMGDYTFTTTLALWVATGLLAGKAYAPAVSGAVLVVGALATIAVGPIAAVFVERWSKVRVCLGADLIRAVFGLGFVALALASAPTAVTTSLCVIGVAVQAVVAQFFNPARMVIIRDMVPASKRGQAASFAQASSAIATVVGPILGGILYVAVGPAPALALNAASFLCSFAAIRWARLPAEPISPQGSGRTRRPLLQELRASFGEVVADKLLRACLAAGAIAMLGAGALGSLDVYFVRENLHAAGEWFGVISASLGAGILLGAVGVGVIGARIGYSRLFTFGLLACGGSYVVYARLTNPVPAVVVVFLYGVAAGCVETAISPMIVNAVPRDKLARVLSIFPSVFRISSVLSVGLATLVVSSMAPGNRYTVAGMEFGRVDTIFLCAGLIFLVAGAYTTLTLPSEHVAVEGGAQVAGTSIEA